ncbi:MAG: DUF4325 domain-containing protein [Bdellovibrionota bacterium]
MKKIKIKEEYKEDYITRAAGERLRTAILDARQNGEDCIWLDFGGVIIGSTSFFDEAIAKLGEEGWDSEIIHGRHIK